MGVVSSWQKMGEGRPSSKVARFLLRGLFDVRCENSSRVDKRMRGAIEHSDSAID
jgi:hypothetical protein